MRFAPRSLLPLSAFLALLLAPRVAVANNNDAAALALRKEAIYDDYLSTRFADAETKLLKALSMCDGAADCEVTTRARLHCDLGVIEFALDNAKEGRAQFASAVRKDPNVQIDHDLSTPELAKEFAAVRNATMGPTAAAPAGDDASAESTPAGESECPPGFPGCKDQEKEAQEKEGTAEEAAPVDLPFKRNWFSLSFQADLLLLPSASNACAGGSGYTCFNPQGYYADRPLANADDLVNGGASIATMRVLFGYDRALTANFMAGARLGYAFNGGPQRPGGSAFEPIHAEARASYWFGHDPLGRTGLRVFVMGAVGMMEVDASIPVDIFPTTAAYQAGQSQNYTAWKKTGLGFVALGLGAMYAITHDGGITLELKGQQMFPTSGAGAALQVGYAIGY